MHQRVIIWGRRCPLYIFARYISFTSETNTLNNLHTLDNNQPLSPGRPGNSAQRNDDEDEILDLRPQARNNNNNQGEDEEDIDDFVDQLFAGGNLSSFAAGMGRDITTINAPIPDAEPAPRAGTIPSFFTRQSSVISESSISANRRRARSTSIAMESVAMESVSIGTPTTPRSERSFTPMVETREEIADVVTASRLPNTEIGISNRYSTRVANENEEIDLSSAPVYTIINETTIAEVEATSVASTSVNSQYLRQQFPPESSSAGPSSSSSSQQLPRSTDAYEQTPLKRKISFMDIDEDDTDTSLLEEDLDSVVN